MERLPKIDPNGTRSWRHPITNRLHREGAPAIYQKEGFTKIESWYVDGYPHRVDGPAIVYKRPVWVSVILDLFALEYEKDRWFINGIPLPALESKLASKILDGSILFKDLPLYLNDPLLKPYATYKLSENIKTPS